MLFGNMTGTAYSDYMSRDASPTSAADIAIELRAAISSGDYRPGDRLPGENPLMETYGVARMTARRALAMLRDEGLTMTRRGVGVFVRQLRPVVRNSTSRLSPTQWRAGKMTWEADHNARNLTVDHIEVTPSEAPDEETRSVLDLDENETVTVRHRRYSLDGKPVMVATSYVPARIAQGTRITETDTGPGGIYRCLDELGYAPAHFREDITSRMPSPSESQVLEIAPGTPVHEIVRTAGTKDGTPVEVNRMILDAAAFVLRYDFDAP